MSVTITIADGIAANIVKCCYDHLYIPVVTAAVAAYCKALLSVVATRAWKAHFRHFLTGSVIFVTHSSRKSLVEEVIQVL